MPLCRRRWMGNHPLTAKCLSSPAWACRAPEAGTLAGRAGTRAKARRKKPDAPRSHLRRLIRSNATHGPKGGSGTGPKGMDPEVAGRSRSAMGGGKPVTHRLAADGAQPSGEAADGDANDQGGVGWGDPNGAFLIPAAGKTATRHARRTKNAAGETGGVERRGAGAASPRHRLRRVRASRPSGLCPSCLARPRS